MTLVPIIMPSAENKYFTLFSNILLNIQKVRMHFDLFYGHHKKSFFMLLRNCENIIKRLQIIGTYCLSYILWQLINYKYTYVN